jgi:hypothetical protein
MRGSCGREAIFVMSDETLEKRKCTWERLWFASYSRVCLQQQTEERRSKTSRSNVEGAMSVQETMVPRLHPTTQLPKATSSPLPGFGNAVPPFCYPSPSEPDMARDCGGDSMRTELFSVQPILHSVDVRYFAYCSAEDGIGAQQNFPLRYRQLAVPTR